MSYDLIISIPPDKVPSPNQWQAAITSHGFPLKIDTDFDVASHTGHLPCEYEGEPSGFEYSYELRDDENPKQIEITLFAHFDHHERSAAAIAAAVLAEISGGTVTDPQEGTTFRGAQAIDWARKTEAKEKQELAEAPDHRTDTRPNKSPKPWWQFWK